MFPILDKKLSSCHYVDRFIAMVSDLRGYLSRAALWTSNLDAIYKRYTTYVMIATRKHTAIKLVTSMNSVHIANPLTVATAETNRKIINR